MTALVEGRRLLACSSAGGHFAQLVMLVDRIPDLASVTWLTHDEAHAAQVLAAGGHGDDQLVPADYAAPRDVMNLSRNARTAAAVLRRRDFDLAISTGAGIAVAVLPLARAKGVRSAYIESATRTDGPSLSGRILRRTPGIELWTQNPGYPEPWRVVGSVHDRFRPGPPRSSHLRNLVVTVGTIRPYGFRRLIERMTAILPPDAEVLWQTGETEVADLGIEGHRRVPAKDLRTVMQEADVVVAHAGTGTAVTAFELGVAPVLVPRRAAHGEHVDDHQVPTAQMLARRGLATHLEVEDLTAARLAEAGRRTVETITAPLLPL